MNRAEILRKAEANEGLTVKEIKIYQKTVKPEKHVYGKYGNLAKQYLQDKGIETGAFQKDGRFYGESETRN